MSCSSSAFAETQPSRRTMTGKRARWTHRACSASLKRYRSSRTACRSIQHQGPFCRERTRDLRISNCGFEADIVKSAIRNPQSEIQTMLAKEIKPGAVVNFNDAPHMIEGVTVHSP